MIALWLFALLGHPEDILLECLEYWPANYRPAARA